MANDDAIRLIADSLEQLGHGLSRLWPDQSGYITAEDYQRITGEELDEVSTESRRITVDSTAPRASRKHDWGLIKRYNCKLIAIVVRLSRPLKKAADEAEQI